MTTQATDPGRMIPHRPPFLFLDEVLTLEESQITARRKLRAEEPHFAGHYPGHPIMPGVLLCEAVFQAAAVLLVHRLQSQGHDSSLATPLLVRIQEAKFKTITRPGDELLISAQFLETVSNFHFLKGSIRTANRLVLTVSFTLALQNSGE